MGCCESRGAPPHQATPADRPIQSTKRPRDPANEEPKKEWGEWPWSRPSPDDRKTFKKQTIDFYYTKEYLQSFKILNAVEAKAYEAYLNNDLEKARSILDNRGVLPTPVLSPLSPTDREEVYLEINTEQVERSRGGSVAAAVPDTQRHDVTKLAQPRSPRNDTYAHTHCHAPQGRGADPLCHPQVPAVRSLKLKLQRTRGGVPGMCV
eukprot:TRINITY_DN17170_c0_g1_i1.p1 TRINITY_DN17170_c0_g1~~TRINITY_DN17170_c0_g1_i1.p1  ORF type:complete len:207 (+),score=32.55 TRINITY_DN17170_c0_g1_i1:37-657(+)